MEYVLTKTDEALNFHRLKTFLAEWSHNCGDRLAIIKPTESRWEVAREIRQASNYLFHHFWYFIKFDSFQ
jgi:hypothetical protein